MLSLTKFGLLVMAACVYSGAASPARGCTCGRDLQPVCGSDGNTYSNDCLLNCAAADNPSVTFAHIGECGSSLVRTPPCVCTFDYTPVCGSDGTTYSNDCALNCETARNPRLRVAHQGQCGHASEPSEPACACTAEYAPVCGSDNVTYGNDCFLNCATAKDSRLRVAKSGPCASPLKIVDVLPVAY